MFNINKKKEFPVEIMDESVYDCESDAEKYGWVDDSILKQIDDENYYREIEECYSRGNDDEIDDEYLDDEIDFEYPKVNDEQFKQNNITSYMANEKKSQSTFPKAMSRETVFYNYALARAEKFQTSKGYPKMNKASVKKYYQKRRDKLPDFMEQQFREAFFTNIFIDKYFKDNLMPNGFYNSRACILGVLNDYELYYIAYQSKLAEKYKYIQTKAKLLLDILKVDIKKYKQKFQRC